MCIMFLSLSTHVQLQTLWKNSRKNSCRVASPMIPNIMTCFFSLKILNSPEYATKYQSKTNEVPTGTFLDSSNQFTSLISNHKKSLLSAHPLKSIPNKNQKCHQDLSFSSFRINITIANRCKCLNMSRKHYK